MKRSAAEIVREYGPFPDVDRVNGVTYDGKQVWIATGDNLKALDPATGKTTRSIDVGAHAGTAFDGQYLYQIGDDRIQKIDPKTGQVLATIPAPASGCSGMAWAEGNLWVAQYEDRKIYQVDPQTGHTERSQGREQQYALQSQQPHAAPAILPPQAEHAADKGPVGDLAAGW